MHNCSVQYIIKQNYKYYRFTKVTACNFSIIILGAPDIDEGPFRKKPDQISPGHQTVNIATPIYILAGNDVTIVCNISSGTPPITVKWYRNGVEIISFSNMSTINVSNVDVNCNDGDMYTCRAENSVWFDEETSIMTVERKGDGFISAICIVMCMDCKFTTTLYI